MTDQNAKFYYIHMYRVFLGTTLVCR